MINSRLDSEVIKFTVDFVFNFDYLFSGIIINLLCLLILLISQHLKVKPNFSLGWEIHPTMRSHSILLQIQINSLERRFVFSVIFFIFIILSSNFKKLFFNFIMKIHFYYSNFVVFYFLKSMLFFYFVGGTRCKYR